MPLKWRQLAAAAPQDRDLSEAELEDLLEQWCPPPRPACLDRVREAAALASYRARPDHVRILVGDDAKQAKHVSDEFGLCWIHEGRHYKELSPVVPQHRAAVGGVPDALLGLLRQVAGIPGHANASDGGAVAGGVRPTVRDTDGLRSIG